MRLIYRALAAGLAAGAAVLALTVGTPGTQEGADAPTVSAIADEAPGYAVEDFAYPHADEILEERGILLKRGDGHIVLADCASEAGLLEVWARSQDKVCFRVTGTRGYLSLEIPAVYGIRGSDHEADVNMTVEDEEKSFSVPKNTWTPVGESADPEKRDHLLVEIITGP